MPSRDEITKAWGDSILPGLKGLAKALYGAGRFVSVDDGVAVFALPDEIHRGRAEEKRTEVEAALQAHFGGGVKLKLVVDRPTDAPLTAEPDHDHDHVVDIHELEDAAGSPATPAERLKQAFPGAQEVDQ